MRVKFKKMSGAGNDFIVVDDRKGALVRLEAMTIQKLCKRKTGVGADGLILISSDAETDFFMAYYNRDGREAELCANGARCSVLFAHELDPTRDEFTFRSMAGSHRGKFVGGGSQELVEIDLPPPAEVALGEELEVFGEIIPYASLVVGVPHVVILRKTGLAELDVERLGRKIREHERFRPKGTNVNFIHVISRSFLTIRTYERGVEEETLACGTGSSASSIAATLWNLTAPPVECRTRGGDILQVFFEHDARTQRISSLRLRGPAATTFEGWVEL